MPVIQKRFSYYPALGIGRSFRGGIGLCRNEIGSVECGSNWLYFHINLDHIHSIKISELVLKTCFSKRIGSAHGDRGSRKVLLVKRERCKFGCLITSNIYRTYPIIRSISKIENFTGWVEKEASGSKTETGSRSDTLSITSIVRRPDSERRRSSKYGRSIGGDIDTRDPRTLISPRIGSAVRHV